MLPAPNRPSISKHTRAQTCMQFASTTVATCDSSEMHHLLSVPYQHIASSSVSLPINALVLRENNNAFFLCTVSFIDNFHFPPLFTFLFSANFFHKYIKMARINFALCLSTSFFHYHNRFRYQCTVNRFYSLFNWNCFFSVSRRHCAIFIVCSSPSPYTTGTSE